MKSNRGLRKRVKLTKNGKLTRKSAFKRHLMSGKPGKRKRRLRRTRLISEADVKRMKRLMGKG